MCEWCKALGHGECVRCGGPTWPEADDGETVATRNEYDAPDGVICGGCADKVGLS